MKLFPTRRDDVTLGREASTEIGERLGEANGEPAEPGDLEFVQFESLLEFNPMAGIEPFGPLVGISRWDGWAYRDEAGMWQPGSTWWQDQIPT